MRKLYHDRAASLDAWLDRLPSAVCDGAPDACELLTAPREPGEVTSRHIGAYIDGDPFADLAPPKVAFKAVAAIPDDALGRLLAVCKGTGFNALRDTAIITVLIDTGMPPIEVSGLRHAANPLQSDVDFDYNVLHATGAGGKRRAVPFGAGTRRALERYIRRRDEVLAAARRPIDGPLWIGALRKGRLTESGIAQMLVHRCEQAGIARISPYELRHTFARRHAKENADKTELKRLLGLRTPQMLSRYRTSPNG